MCHRRVLPSGTRIIQQDTRTMLRTLSSACAPLGTVNMHGMQLPAFDKSRVTEEHECQVFDGEFQCDVILGGDFMQKTGMNLKCDKLEVEWLGDTVPMATLNSPDTMAAHVDSCLAQMEADELGVPLDSCLAVPIMEAKYDKVDAETVIKEQSSHLTKEQQTDLAALLRKHERLFDGSLGKCPGDPMHIELKPGAEPVHRQPYPVPRVHMQTFKKELEHLVSIGVLSPVKDTEWGLPTFITPKKDGRVRWMSDLRELNKVIKQTQHTSPVIADVLWKRMGHEFLTKLNISIQCCTFELDEASKKLCMIVAPFGPHCCNRVPMGLKISPGYAQARICWGRQHSWHSSREGGSGPGDALGFASVV